MSPCCPHCAPFTLHIVHHQLSCGSAPSSFSILVVSVLVLVSNVIDEIPQRSDLLRKQLVLFPKHRTRELHKLSNQLLGQRNGVGQRLTIIAYSLSKRSEPRQSSRSPLSSFCTSLRKEHRTQLVLVHPLRRSSETGFVPALHRTLNSVLILSPNANQLLKNMNSLTVKSMLPRGFADTKAKRRKANRKHLGELRFSSYKVCGSLRILL